MNLQKALDKAKIGIMLNGSVFLSTIAFSMKHSFNEKCPTARTDGKQIEYNPTWFKELTPPQRVALIAHEAWHTALMHMLREGDRDPRLYNRAGDYVINQLLVDDGFELPPDGCQDDRFRDMSTNQVYDIIYKEQEKADESNQDVIYTLDLNGDGDGEGEGNGKKDEPQDDSGDGKSDEEKEQDAKNKGSGSKSKPNKQQQKQELEAHIKSILVKATTQSHIHNENPGNIPGEVLRHLDDLINPKLPWRDILQRFLTEKIKDDYSWQRPNKRFMPDFYLPTQYSETLSHVTIAIDTSGSITDDELRAILSEIQYIRDMFKPQRMTILDCDRVIHNIYEVDDTTHILDLKFSGGGGTSCFPVFNYIEEHPTTALIYFTDLYLTPYNKEVDYPVLWIVYDNPLAKVNVGEITHYKM